MAAVYDRSVGYAILQVDVHTGLMRPVALALEEDEAAAVCLRMNKQYRDKKVHVAHQCRLIDDGMIGTYACLLSIGDRVCTPYCIGPNYNALERDAKSLDFEEWNPRRELLQVLRD